MSATFIFTFSRFHALFLVLSALNLYQKALTSTNTITDGHKESFGFFFFFLLGGDGSNGTFLVTSMRISWSFVDE